MNGDAQSPLVRLRQNLERAVVASDQTFRLVMIAILSRGHILLEDVPGVGKTTLARCMAKSLSMQFRRIQMTPDLLPSDLLGSSVYNPQSASFTFHKGPIFTEVLLADELNRATPRTQSALLEAMEERQVTIDGVSYPLPKHFLVIATQNPVELEGTFPLPEAQKDRFTVATGIGYPTREGQISILRSRLRGDPMEAVQAVVSVDELVHLQRAVRKVEVHLDLLDFVARFGDATRNHEEILLGASPRGLLAWSRAAQAAALLEGRTFTRPIDFVDLVVPALGHRMCLTPEAEIEGAQTSAILRELLAKNPVPVALND